MDTLLEILNPHFLLRNGLYGGLIIGIVAPLVGVYLLARRMVFIGIALPQVSTAGVAGALGWRPSFPGGPSPHAKAVMRSLGAASGLLLGAFLVVALFAARRPSFCA